MYMCAFYTPGLVAKRLNQQRCHLEYELVWAKGTMYQVGA